jgi:hypothetical protein|tara:strand:+ start:346 stop:630 length:285 start_codon:yes stop_codon:yes gene_type:complete
MAKLEMFVNGNFADGEEVYQIGSKNTDGTGETNDGQYDIVVYDPMRKSEAEAKLKELSKGADKSSEKGEEKKAAKKDTETKPAPRKRKAPTKSK